ncbi:hypothetical protein ILYODFUR_004047 [Ilyodon furcidens]|uniref:Uncharacterized protein n=1 Tax=Ilyodon furcidens TaxID=33524 RepID=A0ABV0SWP6_9TELE
MKRCRSVPRCLPSRMSSPQPSDGANEVKEQPGRVFGQHETGLLQWTFYGNLLQKHSKITVYSEQCRKSPHANASTAMVHLIYGAHSTTNLHPHPQVVQRPPRPLYQDQNHGGQSLLLCCTPALKWSPSSAEGGAESGFF